MEHHYGDQRCRLLQATIQISKVIESTKLSEWKKKNEKNNQPTKRLTYFTTIHELNKTVSFPVTILLFVCIHFYKHFHRLVMKTDMKEHRRVSGVIKEKLTDKINDKKSIAKYMYAKSKKRSVLNSVYYLSI